MGKIADLIALVLSGRREPEALGPSWRHDLAMPIYERSCQILSMPRERRRKEIESHPDEIHKLLADEVKRLYRLRKYRRQPCQPHTTRHAEQDCNTPS